MTAESLVRDPESRSALTEWGRQKVEDTNEAATVKFNEIRQKFNDKREELWDGSKARLRDLRNSVNERIIGPTVEGAKRVGKAALSEVETAGLFTAVLVKIGVQLGKEAVVTGREGVVKGVEAGKRTIEEGKAKAREWGYKMEVFFRRQGERLTDGIEKRRREIQAGWLNVLALPRRAEAAIEGNIGKRLAGVAERLNTRAENAKALAQQRQEQAFAIKNAANGLRTNKS